MCYLSKPAGILKLMINLTAIMLLFFLLKFDLISQESSIVIKNVRIFDGNQIQENVTVIFKDGKITGVGENLEIPKEGKLIDGTGKTLIPGLIDSHVHAYNDAALKQALIFGVTTFIDMFTDLKFLNSAKKKQSLKNNFDRSDIISAGTLATVPGGHGTEYGIKIPTITKPEEAESFVDARIAEGSYFIKIIYEDGSTIGMKLPTFKIETLSALINAAHKRDKLAVVHVLSQKSAFESISSGVDGLAHLFMDKLPEQNFYTISKKNNVFFIPTLTVLRTIAKIPFDHSFWQDSFFEPLISSNDMNGLKTSFTATIKDLRYSIAEEIIRNLKKNNLRILAGTDSPNPGTIFGGSLHQELSLFVQAGLTPLEALKSATSIPASVFSLNDRGRIAPGLRADLVLVNGNPAENIRATKDIVSIWKEGIQLNREDYKKTIAKINEENKKEYLKPQPVGSESGNINDFEKGDTASCFGSGWAISTDVIAGGKSKAKMNVVNDGANGTKYSLKIEGEIIGDLMYAWGGAIFYPGSKIFTPANLSSKKEISFWTKGDNQTYQLSIFTRDRGFMPIAKDFKAESAWKQYSFSFSEFDGIDGHNITAIGFFAKPDPKKFNFLIDEVKLK